MIYVVEFDRNSSRICCRRNLSWFNSTKGSQIFATFIPNSHTASISSCWQNCSNSLNLGLKKHCNALVAFQSSGWNTEIEKLVKSWLNYIAEWKVGWEKKLRRKQTAGCLFFHHSCSEKRDIYSQQRRRVWPISQFIWFVLFHGLTARPEGPSQKFPHKESNCKGYFIRLLKAERLSKGLVLWYVPRNRQFIQLNVGNLGCIEFHTLCT